MRESLFDASAFFFVADKNFKFEILWQVPIDPERCEDFDPDVDAPSVAQLLNELDSGAKETSMDRSVFLFEDLFLKGICKASNEELASKTRQAVKSGTFDF